MVYKEVLDSLLRRLHPSQFLRLLPTQGNLSFFLSFIKRAMLRIEISRLEVVFPH